MNAEKIVRYDPKFVGGALNYNPYATRYADLKKALSSAENEKSYRLAQLTLHESFDENGTFAELNFARRALNLKKQTLKKVSVDLAEQIARQNVLKQATDLGWNPRYWFSSERSIKKFEIRASQQQLEKLLQSRDGLQQQIRVIEEQFSKRQAELDRHRSFDRLESEAALKALNPHLEQLKSEIARVSSLFEKVESVLREPLAALVSYEKQKCEVQALIARAERFVTELSNASDSYQRKLIHEQCFESIGDGQPAKVIGHKRRELEHVCRSIAKLEARLTLIARRASRAIKTIVIDGSNLCHQNGTFIGLVALHPVAKRLSKDYRVVIVFDATIRPKLRMPDWEIAANFGDTIEVHVMNSELPADEPLLDAAVAPDAYVISNDHFVEFSDKPVVREKRVIKHEILNNKIFIHDLDVAENISFS